MFGSELSSLAEVTNQRHLHQTYHDIPGFWHRKTILVQSLYIQNVIAGAYNIAVTSNAELISYCP